MTDPIELDKDDARVLTYFKPYRPPMGVSPSDAATRLLAGEPVPFLDEDREGWFDADGYRLEGIYLQNQLYQVRSGDGFHLQPTLGGGVSIKLGEFVVPLLAALWECRGTSLFVRALPAIVSRLEARLRNPKLYFRLDTDDYNLEVDELGLQLECPPPEDYRGTPSDEVRGEAGLVLCRSLRDHNEGNGPWIRVSEVQKGRIAPGFFPYLEALVADLSLFDDDFCALAERIAGTDACGGDPRIAAPECVERIAERFGVSSDAAAWYLMLATLAKPKDALCGRVLGLKKKALVALAPELIATGLVVEDKRSGAGRSVFLPGEWAKHSYFPATEAWKRSHLGWTLLPKDAYGNRFKKGYADTLGVPYRGVIPPAGPTTMYRRVTERVLGGDLPD